MTPDTNPRHGCVLAVSGWWCRWWTGRIYPIGSHQPVLQDMSMMHMSIDVAWVGLRLWQKDGSVPISRFLSFTPWTKSPRIQSMDYLHAFGYARSQSVRPCYLRSDHDFCMHFRQLIFRLISDKFRQSMGNSRWPCHGLSRSVTAFSDNAQDLSIVFCLLSRFVTVCHGLSRNMLGNLKPIWTFFR